MRYFYSWTPIAISGTVALLCLPWLGLVGVMVLALAAVAALAAAIVVVPYRLGRAIGRRRHVGNEASPERAAAA